MVPEIRIILSTRYFYFKNKFHHEGHARRSSLVNGIPLCVARSEIADFVRRSAFYMDFTYPILKAVVTRRAPTEELSALEQRIEERYLSGTRPENPLHFMATWMVRGYLAKFLLMEHHAKYLTASLPDEQRDAAICLTMRRLESDTKLMSSPLTRGYLWLLDFHLPYPAYVHIFQELIRRPSCEHAERAWEVISDNFVVRSTTLRTAPKPIFGIFTKLVLQSWAACEADAIGRGKPLTLPNIVFIVKSWLAENVANSDAHLPLAASVMKEMYHMKRYHRSLHSKTYMGAGETLLFNMIICPSSDLDYLLN